MVKIYVHAIYSLPHHHMVLVRWMKMNPVAHRLLVARWSCNEQLLRISNGDKLA
jgi:hypothetical protein